MKITKQKFILQTAMFVVITGLIIVFKSVFGSENSLIGVTTVTAALMFLERDYTLNPLKNTFKFILINLLIGIATLLANSNMYLAIFINFSIVFIIAYTFCDNLRNPIYVPFGLQYLFVLVTPVTGDKIWTRFAALVVGALFIMLVQLIANKNKLAKNGNTLLSNICDLIINKLEGREINLEDIDRNKNIYSYIDEFREMIYDKREYNYYLTEEGRVKLNISVALENINSMLTDNNIKQINKDILDTLIFLIKESKSILHNNKESKNNTSNFINELLKICENKNLSDLLNLQLLDSMILLSDNLEELKQLDEKHFNLVNKTHEITEIFTDNKLKSVLMDKKSLRFCYAMRLSITIAFGAFIMDYFHLAQGKWILFTILSLTTPLYEVSKSKTKDRLIATLVGSLITFILLTVFNTNTGIMIIVMLAGYLNGFFDEYKYKMIFNTMSAIGSAALVDSVSSLTLDRILFVALGAVIAVAANKYLLPYSVKDSINHLKEIYHTTIVSMLTEIKYLLEGNKRPNHMKNFMVLTSLIDSTARTNVELTSSPAYNEVITERRNLVANIYELYILILKKEVDSSSYKKIIPNINELIKFTNEDTSSGVKNLEDVIQSTKDMNSKIILSSMSVILQELSHLNQLNKAI